MWYKFVLVNGLWFNTGQIHYGRTAPPDSDDVRWRYYLEV